MKTLTFKSNINCENCVAKITPKLNAIAELAKWEVDIKHPDKILSVSGKDIQAQVIENAITSLGFAITPIQNNEDYK